MLWRKQFKSNSSFIITFSRLSLFSSTYEIQVKATIVSTYELHCEFHYWVTTKRMQ